MKIVFKQLTLENFKNHKNLVVDYEQVTQISGKNGFGKTSIGEAVTWLLYGTDLLGTKIEPQPLGTEEEVHVSLLINADGKDLLLTKKQKKTAKYAINEVPRKATEFADMIDSLFEKNLFYSLYSPGYFFSQHWQTQREQLLSYVTEPGEKEVLEEMNEIDRTLLSTELNKHLLDDLEAVNRETFKNSDKQYERASERVLTLKEQLSNASEVNMDIKEITEQKDALIAERTAIELKEDKNVQLRNDYADAEQKINALKERILRKREEALNVREQKIEENCEYCGQTLQGDSIEHAIQYRKEHYNRLVTAGKIMVEELEASKARLAKLENPEKNFDRVKYKEIDEKILELSGYIQSVGQTEKLHKQIADAELEQQRIRKQRNKSQSIVEAIKRFKAKRSDLMVEKVNGLFENITIKLYEVLKNGTEKPTFEVEWQQKPYSKLSTAEKIIAGIEFANTLSLKAETIVPLFADNAESVIELPKPTGQLITATVKKTKFTVKGVSENE
ncbi:ATPase [Listeria monocytogenes]|nr:ATPase [Listeria monocytogenes]EAC5566740.1 ATPase [Listeria monocytogenes]EAC8928644.1 ATPase [Listeria monocytogenes]EAC8946634.1 ATPase [Listeria monocytogenes]EAE6271762.1 ATPase [Listeria monocytogenes]